MTGVPVPGSGCSAMILDIPADVDTDGPLPGRHAMFSFAHMAAVGGQRTGRHDHGVEVIVPER